MHNVHVQDSFAVSILEACRALPERGGIDREGAVTKPLDTGMSADEEVSTMSFKALKGVSVDFSALDPS